MAISNDLYKVMVKRYESEIADAAVKLKLYIEGPQVIPEHPDITAEIDKLVSSFVYLSISATPAILMYEKRKSG